MSDYPSDWEDFDLLQDNEARYFYGGPSALGTPRLWGLPVVGGSSVMDTPRLWGLPSYSFSKARHPKAVRHWDRRKIRR